jgi:hypothetical protein
VFTPLDDRVTVFTPLTKIDASVPMEKAIVAFPFPTMAVLYKILSTFQIFPAGTVSTVLTNFT